MSKGEKNHRIQSFADYMDATDKGKVQFLPGQLVESRIVAISNDTVFLELNGKSEGILDKAELLDTNGELPFK